MKKKLTLAASILSFAGALALIGFGCKGGPPSALFSPATNVLSEVVVPRTNTVTLTNIVVDVVTRTNFVTLSTGERVPQILITPVERAEIVTKSVVEFQTNQVLKVTYVPTDMAKEMADGAGSITNVFAPGLGGLVGKGLTG